MPMLELVKFPANANILNEMMIKIASFEVIPIGEDLNEQAFYFPESDPISQGAKLCEIEGIFIIDNLGTKYWAAKL